MNDFFRLDLVNGTNDITALEKYFPIILVVILIMFIKIFKNSIKRNAILDKYLRYSMSLTSIIFLVIYYYLEWTTYGVKLDNLPLHLCFISSILSSVLCFKSNKTLFNFVFFTGILGGASSLFFPMLDLTWKSFRYFEFMFVHGLIIIIPIYYVIIYEYFPSFLETLKVIFHLEILAFILGIFNELYNTTYMFVSFTSNSAAKDSVLYSIGTGFAYFINLQLITISTILVFYLLCKVIFSIKIKLPTFDTYNT